MLRAPHRDAHPLLHYQKVGYYTASKPVEAIAVSSILLALAILVFHRARIHLLAWKLKRNLLVIRSTSNVSWDEERVLESLGQSIRIRSHPTSQTTTLESQHHSLLRLRAVTGGNTVESDANSILSTFRLLFFDFEGYKHGFKQLPLSRFRNVSKKLNSVKRGIVAEERQFLGTVKHIAQPMVSSTELRSRLGSAYPVFEKEIISLKQTTSELQKLFANSGQVSHLDLIFDNTINVPPL